MVISSHGSEDEVTNSDNPDFRKKEVKFYQHRFSTRDGSIQTSEIINMFDDGKCRALKGKPKVFFMQVNKPLLCNLAKRQILIVVFNDYFLFYVPLENLSLLLR
jgi:hypothetical protein